MKNNFLKVIIFLILYRTILSKEALSLEINKSNLTIDNIASSNYRRYEIGEISNLTHFVVSLKSEDELKKKPVDIICLVDISFRLKEYFNLIQKTLIRLSIPLKEQDSLAIITFYQSGNIITNLTKMTPENHNLITNKIYGLKVENKGYLLSSYLKYGFKIALDFLTQDYSSAERIASIFIFAESSSNFYWGLDEFMHDIRMNNTFTINGFFYGKSRSSSEIYIPRFKDGGYYIIREESEIPDIVKQIYGALSSVSYVNIELEIKTNYEIKHVFGKENMYEASLTSKNNTFNNKIIHFISGKKYTFNFLLDIPQNIPLGTEVLKATVLPLKISSQYNFDQKNNSFAYEEFIKCMVYTYICDAIIFESDTTSFAQKGINWIQTNYKGQNNWVKVLEDVIIDAKNNLVNNIESKKRSLIYSPLGNNLTSNNFIQNSINYSPHWKYYTQFPIIKVTKEKIIKIEDNIFYYSFYLKEGIGEINGMPFYGNGTNIIIYSEDNTDNINIKSLSDNLEFYYFNQSITEFYMDLDFNNGGTFIIKRDFPLAFYSWIDGARDITFNIEFLKLEGEGKADKIIHLFEIDIYTLSQLELANLNAIHDLSKEARIFQGFYDEKLKLGRFVIRKEEIIKYINKYDGRYLYIVVSKKDNSNIYKYIEGKFIFSSSDYIYSPIPEDFYIFSNLSKENKYHLYMLTMEELIGKYLRIEFGTSSNQIDCKILKYKGYEENSEELYVDYNEYNITRTKNKTITYIDVFQSDKEETKIECIIVSIIFKSINSNDISDTSDYSYTFKYNSYSYNKIFNKNNNDNSQSNNSSKDSDTNNSYPIDSNGNNNNNGDNEIINSKVKFIFLGFAKFIYIRTIKISYFYIYFASSIKKVSITKILLYIRIKYKTNVESLQSESKQIQCLLFENEFTSQNQFRYNCSFETNGEELENVEIIENNLDGQNIEIIDNSSMAIQFMDNIQNVGDTDIFNKKLYIFKNSILHIDYNKKIFNITGTIDDNSFHYVSLYLTIIIIEHDNSKQKKDIYCDIYNLNDNNYKLVCNLENETYLKLNGAFANLGEENLVINFNDDINSTIYFNSSTDNIDEIHLYIKNKKKKKMSKGAIIAIILPIIFVMIFIILFLICLNKEDIKVKQNTLF